MADCLDQVPWYRSQRFIALCQSTVVYALGWLIAALSSNDWSSWKALLIAILGNVLLTLRDWWSPAVIAPFALMNKSNPAISVKDLQKAVADADRKVP